MSKYNAQSAKTYYEKIDPTGFRISLMAQIESRSRTVHDLLSHNPPLPLHQYYQVGTSEELASMLLSCILCLPMSERKNLIGLKE